MLIYFDTETTGLDAKSCRITELAAYSSEGKQMDVFLKLPEGEKVPEFITELTGIDNETLEKEGITEEEALAEFLDMFSEDETTYLVAHNCQFDVSFVREAILRHPEHQGWLGIFDSADLIDTKTIFQARYESSRHRLSDAIEIYGLQEECKNSHRAIDDAYALKRVFEKMAEEKNDVWKYVNVFAIHPKYGISGDRLAKVSYGLMENGEISIEGKTYEMDAA